MPRSTHDSPSPPGHKPKRLSLDSLPPYYPRPLPLDPPSDRPPDYPESDSADEADHEDEEEDQFHSLRKTPSLARPSPRHRFHHTPWNSLSISPFYNSQSSAISDSHLDSLLERSVHALEMSNVLLQTSNSHRQSFISSPRYELRGHRTPPRRYRPEPIRQKPQFIQEPWMKELAELQESVDDLFGDEHRNPTNNGHGISKSLPASDFHMPPPKPSTPSHLHFGHNDAFFRSHPPRQMTQYTSAESGNGSSHLPSDSIQLPSTIGLRAGGLVTRLPSTSRRTPRRAYSHDFASRPPSDSAGTSPAQSYLSQLAGRPGRSSSFRSGIPHEISPRNSLDGSRTIGRGRISQSRPSSRDSSSSQRSMSPLPTLEIRPMTPPLEESTPPSSESSTPAASQALECLRKILQDAPEPAKKPRVPPPPLLISNHRSSPSAPEESNTTASIFRLHSRGTHRSSTSDSPPKQSSLKQPSSPMLSSPGQLSPISSGRSTPRHKVQFAELPESYSSSRPGSRMKSNSKSSKSKKSDTGGWWKTFWSAGDYAAHSPRGSRFEERIEDRVARSWGRPPFGMGGLDEWSIQ